MVATTGLGVLLFRNSTILLHLVIQSLFHTVHPIPEKKPEASQLYSRYVRTSNNLSVMISASLYSSIFGNGILVPTSLPFLSVYGAQKPLIWLRANMTVTSMVGERPYLTYVWRWEGTVRGRRAAMKEVRSWIAMRC